MHDRKKIAIAADNYKVPTIREPIATDSLFPVMNVSHLKSKTYLAVLTAFSLVVASDRAVAQSIIPASDGTGTLVNINGNEFVIDGGTLSGDGANLFHSFLELGLDANQIATFLSNPQIQNILGRVTGGNPSVIDGLIQVMGGNSNLYLMNPSGFVFGSNASLNVPGDFFATTADRIGFGNGLWFDVLGDNNYENLTGTPIEFGFGENAGAIVNGGDLAVGEGQTLALLGSQVINTGSLSAPSGNIAISAVGETGRLRMVRQGNVLGFEFVPPTDAKGNALPIAVTDIPALITGSGVNTHVTVAGDRLLHNGTELPNSVGSVALGGELETAGQTGGNVNVVGDIVALLGVAIDASGTEGGGNVRIGGNAKETGKKFNARRTLVDRDTVLNTDALVSGNGGRIVVSADENLGFFGDASARGGRESGDGGLIAIASNNNLVFDGNLDVGAAVEETKNGDRTLLGENGTIRFKAKNIRIQPSGTIQETIANSESAILFSEVVENGSLAIGDTVISELTGNLILQADRDIFVEADSSDLANSLSLAVQDGDFSLQDESQETQVFPNPFADLFPDPSKLSEIGEIQNSESSPTVVQNEQISQYYSKIMEQA
ncbi:MAG: filamentous hemagglutinin N-terminal domain-containing protein, partial [Spirulina sp.]